MAEAKRPGSGSSIVQLSPLAEADQLLILAYTTDYWGQAQAENYLALIDSVMLELAETPASAAELPDLPGIRCYTVKWPKAKYGHRIFFRTISGGIFIMRILHTARNWQEIIR